MTIVRAALAAILAIGLLAAPLCLEAQQAAKVPRVGVLSPGKPPPDDGGRTR